MTPHTKGNIVIDTIMLICANALAWLWKHVIPPFTNLHLSRIDFGQLHDILASLFTLISMLYLIWKWRKDAKQNKG